MSINNNKTTTRLSFRKESIRNGKLNINIETSDMKKPFTSKQKVALCLLAAVDFMSYCQMSIMAPFYPQEAASRGMSETLSGFVFSFYALVMFIFAPVFGKILPKVGVKLLFIVGILTSGICSIIFGCLEYVYDEYIFLSFSLIIRGLDALGACAYCTASYVLICNIFPYHAAMIRGVMETFVGLGMSVGPAIGGFLFDVGGFSLPFYVVGIIVVTLAPLNAYFLESEFTIDSHCGSIKTLLKLPGTCITCLIIIVVAISWGFIDPTLEPGLRKFNLTSTTIGLIFLLLSVTYAISCPILGWVINRTKNYWITMVFGLFFISICLLLLGPSPFLDFLDDSLPLTIVSLALFGAAVGIALMPTYQKLVDSALDGGLQDTLGTQSIVAGLWSCAHSLGEVIGPSIGGAFLEHFGFGIACTFVAILNFTTSIVALFYFSLQRNKNVYQNSMSDTIFDRNARFKKRDWDNGITTIS